MNSISRTSGSVSTSVSKTRLYRNELLNGVFAAIDIEYHKNDDKSGDQKPPYTIFAVSIVDSMGNVKAKHIFDFADECMIRYATKQLQSVTIHEKLP